MRKITEINSTSRTTLYRSPDTQLHQVCGQQASEGVYEGPEACLWRCQQGCR